MPVAPSAPTPPLAGPTAPVSGSAPVSVPAALPARLRAVRRALLPTLAALIVACGPGPPPPRLVVVARDPTWELRRAAPSPASFGRAWTFDTPGATWSPAGLTTLRRIPGELLVAGTDRPGIEGPHDVGVDPDLLHRLVLSAETRGVGSVQLMWRGVDGGFDEFRTHVWTLESDGEQTLSVPLTRLRGLTARPAGEPPFRLLFVSATEGGEATASVRRIDLVSDFDPPPGTAASSRPPRWWTRAGLSRQGVLLRPGETLACRLAAEPGDLLALSLTSVGTELPVEVDLDLGFDPGDGAGEAALDELRCVVPPGATWTDARRALPGDGGAPVVCRLSLADGTPPDAVVLVGGVLQLSPRAAPLPDIVLYVEDTLRADRLTTYGYDQPTDPALARIAAAGVVFENAIAASNWTRPSITTMLTSLDPLAHGNRSRRTRIGADVVTLAQALADAGYITAAFVTNWHAGSWSGLDRGFDLASEPVAFGAVGLDTTLTSGLVAGPVEDFLAAHAGSPLFVYVHTLDPHHPYRPPERDLEPLRATASTRAPAGAPTDAPAERAEHSLLYDAEVRHNDRQLARLDQALQRLGLLDDTLFVFASDHGEGFGEHGHFQHRKALFQEELGVPWILRWPARLPAGRRCAGTVGHIDLAPTVLGLAGFSAPPGWQGRDLSAWALADTPPDAGAVPVLAPVLAEVALPAAQADGYAGELAVVLHPHKLLAAWTEDGQLTPRALYDLRADPAERHDLLRDPSRADVVARLAAWASEQLARSRARAKPGSAEALDPETTRWMEAMGYLK